MTKKTLNDKLTNMICLSSTILFIITMICLLCSLLWNSRESILQTKFMFFTKTTWNAKFLELARVRSSKNQEFILHFTVPLQTDQSMDSLFSISYNQQNLNSSILFTNNIVTIKPEKWLDGNYQIFISSNLRDVNNYALTQNITWNGVLNTKKNIILSPKILGEKTGLITNVIADENKRHFNILPFIIGTLISSLMALFFAFPVALAVSLLITEYTAKNSIIIKIFITLIDLLAGIPSVIYGLWGLFFLVPRLGANLFTSALVLSIMIMPYAASLSREAISLVPNKLKQAGIGLGASRFNIIRYIILPYARSGIIAGILLTLGRALGETLAVTMVIGNRNQIPTSLFDPAQTISSLIANEYGEASGLKQSALIEAGLVLMIIVLIFSLLGRMIIRSASQNKS